MGINRGEEFHAEKSSADASGGVTLNYFSQGGRARTIAAQEVLMVTDLTLISLPGGAVTIKAVNGTNNMTLAGGTVAANGGLSRSFSSPFAVPRGWTLKLTAPAGQVDAQIEGFVIH